MSKSSQCCKYFHIKKYTNSFSPLIHTSRNSGILRLKGKENSNEPGYQNCFRPAKLNVADEPDSDLAGQPRSIDKCDSEGIRPEIYDKWNHGPKIDRHKEWTKLPLFD